MENLMLKKKKYYKEIYIRKIHRKINNFNIKS